VLSGVNRGLHVGRLLLHSGTVGAALTAVNLGIPAVAASLEPSEHADWEAAAVLAVEQLAVLLAGGRPVACNLNVPARWGGVPPVPAILADAGRVTAAVEHDRFDFELVVSTGHGAEEGSDAALLAQGYATTTLLEPLGGVPPTPVSARLEPRERDEG
jgi:5'-nucleotidase